VVSSPACIGFYIVNEIGEVGSMPNALTSPTIVLGVNWQFDSGERGNSMLERCLHVGQYRGRCLILGFVYIKLLHLWLPKNISYMCFLYVFLCYNPVLLPTIG
jgi:hypothetical protein